MAGGRGPQDPEVIQEDDVHVRAEERQEHLPDVAAREEEGHNRYRDIQQEVRIAGEVHGGEIGEVPLGLHAPHVGVRADEELEDVARQVDGEEGLGQEGREEACRERVPEEEVPQRSLHGVGLEDLQDCQVLQGQAAGGPRVHPHHHDVSGVGCHGHVHRKVHEASQEVQRHVRHLRCVLAPEPRGLGHRPADKVHGLVAGDHQQAEKARGQDGWLLASGVGEGRDVHRVGQVEAERPEAERQCNEDDAKHEPHDALLRLQAEVPPLHGLGLKRHFLQLAEGAAALVVGVAAVVAELEALRLPAHLHGLVAGLLRGEDDEGLPRRDEALEYLLLPRTRRSPAHAQLQEVLRVRVIQRGPRRRVD
mmetsp:Transcript_136499/g.424119  ORF Transcript_136499/g.424119 Transcript_136499/m.424119 type:complete len:364 (+) Transcript_136499:709-1800(+)